MAKGFTQQKEVEYTKIFSLIAKMVTVWAVLSLVISSRWNLLQMNVYNELLQADLYDKIYMWMPLVFSVNFDFVIADDVPSSKLKVCQLLKSLYGLKGFKTMESEAYRSIG